MTETTSLAATGLTFADVALSLVSEQDKNGLQAAADAEETWKWYPFRGDGEHFDSQLWAWLMHGKSTGDPIPFVVHYKGKIVGTTCFLAIDQRNRRVEIGGTWYRDRVRGGVVNPACKRLLIQRAFD